MELYLRVLSVIDYYAHSTIQSNISALCVVHEWHSCVLRVLPTVLHKAIEIFFFFFQFILRCGHVYDSRSQEKFT